MVSIKLEVYPLEESVGADGGSEIGSSNGSSDNNVDVEPELSSLEHSLGTDG